VLVYAPPLFAKVGPRLGPVRLFDDLDQLWRAVEEAVGDAPTVRVFPQGGLTYCPEPDIPSPRRFRDPADALCAPGGGR
jgi:hypothetical protein